MQLSITKTTQSKNGQKTWIDISPKKTYRWPTNTWKDAQHHSLSEKCKLKPQRYHLMQIRMATITKSTKNKFWRGCGEKRTLLQYWWKCKLVQPLWRTVRRFLDKTGNRTAIWPSNPTPGHTHWGNQNWKRHIYPNVHHSTVYNRQDMEATWMSIGRRMDMEAMVHIHHGILLSH